MKAVDKAVDKAVEVMSFWEVTAGVSQALAAIGALALLFVTWRGGRDTREAIKHSGKLADATEALVAASDKQQRLAVMPVLEVKVESYDQRLRISNRGNGPLLNPRAILEGNELKLVAETAGSGYSEVAVLSRDSEALVSLKKDLEANATLSLSGFTINGGEFTVSVVFENVGADQVFVAQERSLG